jgi:hypothetical protein
MMRYEHSGNHSILYIGMRGFIPTQASSNRACSRE